MGFVLYGLKRGSLVRLVDNDIVIPGMMISQVWSYELFSYQNDGYQ